jgi:fumarate reductase subunit D
MSAESGTRSGRLDGLLWAIFANCAVITAILLPAHIFVQGVLGPLHLAPVLDQHYDSFRAALLNPIVKTYFGLVAALCFYTFGHRVKYMLIDLGVPIPKYWLSLATYGVAAAGCGFAGYVLASVP